jgi:hypothetical protein
MSAGHPPGSRRCTRARSCAGTIPVPARTMSNTAISSPIPGADHRADRVGAQFLGSARAASSHSRSGNRGRHPRIAAICGMIHARYRRGKPTARLQTLQDADRQWRETLPLCGRVAIETRLDCDGKTLRITELRKRPSMSVGRLDWDQVEPGLRLVAVGLEALPRHFPAAHATLASRQPSRAGAPLSALASRSMTLP